MEAIKYSDLYNYNKGLSLFVFLKGGTQSLSPIFEVFASNINDAKNMAIIHRVEYDFVMEHKLYRK